MKPRMIFRDIDGSPVPSTPFDQHGTPIAPNGATLLGIEDAMLHFDSDRTALAVLYGRVMQGVVPAGVLADLMREEGGIG